MTSQRRRGGVTASGAVQSALPGLGVARSYRGRHGSMESEKPSRQEAMVKREEKEGPRSSATVQQHRFFCQSCFRMPQCADQSIALTLTSPPYWNAIDYDIHARKGAEAWHRERAYGAFGKDFEGYLENIDRVFREVWRATMEGGFCAIVIGTILNNKKHYPAPMMIVPILLNAGWDFHQDIIWNKVTGGVKRAGSFIQKPRAGYYYPNIMTEYILVFRKPGEPRRGTKQAMAIDDLFTRDIANNVWHIAPVPPRTIAHPCPFPDELARRLVVLYSQEGDEVLDPFLGSGQTAIAALREHRRCVGYDVEMEYLDLSRARIEEAMQGREAKRKYHLLPRWDKVAAG